MCSSAPPHQDPLEGPSNASLQPSQQPAQHLPSLQQLPQYHPPQQPPQNLPNSNLPNIILPNMNLPNNLLNRVPIYVHPSLYRSLKVWFPLDVGGLSRDGRLTIELGTGSLRQAIGIFTFEDFRPIVDTK